MVAGGSFASELPSIQNMSREDRRSSVASTRARAVETALSSLITAAGLPPDICISRGPDGDRLWPSGYVGSVTHKGTVVLAALSPESLCRILGVDIERIESRRPVSIELKSAEVPNCLPHSAGLTVAFSVKEAAFKAVFPVTRTVIRFSDLQLEWTNCGNSPLLEGTIAYASTYIHVCAHVVDSWVVSAAFSPLFDFRTQAR